MRRGSRDEQRPGGRGGRPERPRGTDRGPRPGRPAGDPARFAAYQALLAVHRDDAYANLILPSLLREAGLSGRDAAFATELTYGTLRHRASLDAVIARAAGRDVARIDPPARDALRLGAYQLLHTRVPPHAAVASTVDLVRSVAQGATGFANAVLRRIGERDLDAWLDAVAPSAEEDPVGRLALTRDHPEWIVRAFRDALGGDLAETERALAADNERPEVHLCARPGLIDPADLADSVGGVPGAFSPYAVYLPAGSPGDLPEIRDGRAHVQDEGSQLVALALLAAPLEGRDERWLDLCAGPGGKAGLLAATAALRGAHLTAVEVNQQRAAMVANAVQGLPATVEQMDGRDIGPQAWFDRVLVDAPCTGLGSLRRRPESRWRKQPSDLPPLTKLQRELLAAALRATRPGGLVAYVTCSPHPVETRLTVEETLRRSGGAELLDARDALRAAILGGAAWPRHTDATGSVDLSSGREIQGGAVSPGYDPDSADAAGFADGTSGPRPTGGMPGLGQGPMVQLWPHRHGTDAMFLALLRRTP